MQIWCDLIIQIFGLYVYVYEIRVTVGPFCKMIMKIHVFTLVIYLVLSPKRIHRPLLALRSCPNMTNHTVKPMDHGQRDGL